MKNTKRMWMFSSILVSLLFVTLSTKSQIPIIGDIAKAGAEKALDAATGPQAVIDVSVLGVIKDLFTNAKNVKAQADSLMASAEFLTKLREDGPEIKRLYFLTQSMACGLQEFEFSMNLLGDLKFCAQRLKVDMTMSRLDGIPTRMKVLLSAVMNYSKSDTGRFLKDINDAMEKSINELMAINIDLNDEIDRRVDRLLRENLTWADKYPDLAHNAL